MSTFHFNNQDGIISKKLQTFKHHIPFHQIFIIFESQTFWDIDKFLYQEVVQF